MNFDFIKNRTLDKKSALIFNIFVSAFLWLLLILIEICIYLFGQFVGFAYDITKYVICFYVLDLIFITLVYKFLVLKFLEKKYLTIFLYVIIPAIVIIGLTSYFWYFIIHLSIVGNINIL
jgi:hypothetical protein